MPSIVVMARDPIDPTANRQDRTGAPSTCTVQAPHCAMPHPNLVPVSPRISRSTQSSGISGGASTFLTSLLIRRLTIGDLVNTSGRWYGVGSYVETIELLAIPANGSPMNGGCGWLLHAPPVAQR